MSEKSPQTTPNYPPFGGVVWGGLGGLSKHRFGAPKSALFPGPVFDHDFGLVFEVFSKGVLWGGSRRAKPRPKCLAGLLGALIYILLIFITPDPPYPPYPPLPGGGPVWGRFRTLRNRPPSPPKLTPFSRPTSTNGLRSFRGTPEKVLGIGLKVGVRLSHFLKPLKSRRKS